MAQPVAREVRYPHIVVDPDVSGGQPVIEGSRIPVSTLVRAHQLGLDFEEILTQYPGLGPADLHAALLYYLDHPAEVDALLQESTSPLPSATVIVVNRP